MNNLEFWQSITDIINKGFDNDGNERLKQYGDQFVDGRLLFTRYTIDEQRGCAAGGDLHVAATLLASAEIAADRVFATEDGFKRQQQCAEKQIMAIENWAKSIGCWFDYVDKVYENYFGAQLTEGGEAHIYDNGQFVLKRIGLDYFVLPILALDRITLHNTLFPSTNMFVMGFGRTTSGEFQILVKQQFIQGVKVLEEEIQLFAEALGFKLISARNWTYATPHIYLSDLHDENVIKSLGGNIFVIDCDIRINTPELRCGGVRELTNEVTFLDRGF